MKRNLRILTQTQIDQFLDRGWCKVEDCFSSDAAREVRERWIQEQGLDPDKPLEWGFDVKHQSLKESLKAADFAPKALAAAEDLVGVGRMEEWIWNNFIVNVGIRRNQPWAMPGPEEGWHIDGIFFHHFLDSPEQGLLTVELYSDVEPGGGGTAICEGSPSYVARALAEYPEGIDPFQAVALAKSVIPFEKLPKLEATGRAGTVYFCHPFMLHASSPNVRGVPRFATNATVFLKEPMRFDEPEKASVVEESVIRYLGGPLKFQITGQRRRYKPEEYKNFYEVLPKKKVSP
jgi:hypothetical protein